MPPSFRRTPLTEEEKLIIAERRARFEKASPLVIAIVTTARSLGRPDADEQEYLPGAVTQLTHLSEGVLHMQNLWKRGGRLGYNGPPLKRRLEGAVKVAEYVLQKAKEEHANPHQVAADQACLHSCKAILLASQMLERSWDALPTQQEIAAVIDVLVVAHSFSQLRRDRATNPDKYVVELAKEFKRLGAF